MTDRPPEVTVASVVVATEPQPNWFDGWVDRHPILYGFVLIMALVGVYAYLAIRVPLP